MANPTDSELLRPYVPRLVVDWLRNTPTDLLREVDGSLAFVDISGFTQLTERLARRGRVGAEEMSDTLNATFAALLAAAYDDGAGLVKWGGDAVLLLFDGPDHAQRACRAAHHMRATLRDVGRLETTAGKIVLRMSVGIHSGRFQFFLVGDPTYHRELLIAGPAASRTAEIESVVSAGEIGISPQTAESLDRGCVGKAIADAFLLKSAPNVAAIGAPPASDVSGLDLSVLIPKPIRDHLLARPGDAEHRSISVGFVQFSGTDALMYRDGPEALAIALDECVRNVQEATARFGVTFFETDIDRDGGKIMLVAGAPTSAGNDEERLLRTARLIADRIGRLPLRIGINRGAVFAGDFGPKFRRTFSVKGDAVNLAARVMGKAEPGQVLSTIAAIERSHALFELEPLPPFMVKGKAQPIEAASVGPLAGERGNASTDLPLIGREKEMEALTEALEHVQARLGGFVVLTGEPGVGKSRLVNELSRNADNIAVVATVCTEYESSSPYFAFRALLRDVLGLAEASTTEQVIERLLDRVAVNAPALLPWLPLLAIPLAVTLPETPETQMLDERFRKARLEDIAVEFLSVVLPSPTLILIEDAHFIDEASADLLARLAHEIPSHPWLFLLTRRDDGSAFQLSQDAVITEYTVGPLDEGATAELVAACLAERPLPPYEMATLARRSGGNPLFVRVLVRSARTAGGTTALPESIEDVVTSQIDRLAPDERAVLRYAAVLGLSFTEAQLRDLLVDEALPTGRDAIKRLGEFIRPAGHGRFSFQQALIRDVAYEGLPYRRRQILHGRVGDDLENSSRQPSDDAELLSLHFFNAARFEKAWIYSRVAGDRARGSYAYVEAAEFYTRATMAARGLRGVDPVELGAVFEALGDASLRIGSFDNARRAYRTARRYLVDDTLHTVDLLRKEAVIEERLDRARLALRTLSRAIALLDGSDTSSALAARARLLGAYAVVREKQGRYRDAIRWGIRAEAAAQAANDDRALAEAYEALHSASSMAGVAQAQPYGRLALGLFDQLGDREAVSRALNNLGVLAWFDGRGGEALAMFDGARDAASDAGDTLGAAASAHNVGDVLLRQGRLEESQHVLSSLLPIFKGLGSEEYWASALRWLGLAAARAGDVSTGRNQVARARAVFADLGLAAEIVETDTAAIEILLIDSRIDEASALCDAALARAASLGAGYLLPTLRRLKGMALAAGGHDEEATSEFTHALRECEVHGNVERGFIRAELARLGSSANPSGADEMNSRSAADLAQLGFVGSDRYPV